MGLNNTLENDLQTVHRGQSILHLVDWIQSQK